MIGGVVALVVELVLFPVRTRERLVESLAAALRHISEMESCLASGIEERSNFDVFNADVLLHFDRASGKANSALSAAETFRKNKCLSSWVRLSLMDSQFHSAARSPESKVHSKVPL